MENRSSFERVSKINTYIRRWQRAAWQIVLKTDKEWEEFSGCAVQNVQLVYSLGRWEGISQKKQLHLPTIQQILTVSRAQSGTFVFAGAKEQTPVGGCSKWSIDYWFSPWKEWTNRLLADRHTYTSFLFSPFWLHYKSIKANTDCPRQKKQRGMCKVFCSNKWDSVARLLNCPFCWASTAPICPMPVLLTLGPP